MYKSQSGRIIEVSENERAVGMIDKITSLDLKYELFCKWLQQNEHNPMLNDERDAIGGGGNSQLTEDEVSSLATNSDDSGSDDIFLDTEPEFPLIVLSHHDNAELLNDVDHHLNNGDDEFRVDTPSQLSVSDCDCSSSDITINSKLSATSGSSSQIKRKVKHKKGRAPPIPIAVGQTKAIDVSIESGYGTGVDQSTSTHLPSNTRSTRETDI